MAIALEPLRGVPLGVIQHPHHSDDRRRQDGLTARLIVEGNVASHDREIERTARVRDPLDGTDELPEDLRTLGRAEVETVGHAEGSAPGTGHVPGRLRHRHGRPAARVERDVTGITVGGDNNASPRALDAQHGRVGARRPRAC